MPRLKPTHASPVSRIWHSTGWSSCYVGTNLTSGHEPYVKFWTV